MNDTFKIVKIKHRLDFGEQPQVIKAGTDHSIYLFVKFECIIQFDTKVRDNWSKLSLHFVKYLVDMVRPYGNVQVQSDQSLHRSYLSYNLTYN